MKSLITIGLSCFLTASIVNAQVAPKIRTDVAIDAVSKDTFVLSQTNNLKGEILLVRDGQSTETVLTISNAELPDAHYEIELSGEDRLTYLMSMPNAWVLGEFQKQDGVWAKTANELQGRGKAYDLARTPDGKLVLTAKTDFSDKSDILLIQNQPYLRILEQMDGEKVATYIAQNLAQTSVIDTSRINTSQTLSRISGSSLGHTPKIEGSTGNGFGLTAGLITGIGLSYRRFFNDKHGLQVGGIALASSNSSHANLGVQYLRTLHHTEKTRFYWLAGVSTHYNRDKVYDYSEIPLDHQGQILEPTERWQTRRFYNFGAGIGMEMRWGPVGASLELPISARFSHRDGETEFDSIYPIPNFSIIYYIPKKD